MRRILAIGLALMALVSPASAGTVLGPWTAIGPAGRVTALAVDPSNPDRLLAAPGAGGIWKSGDGGHTWTRVPTFPSAPVADVVFHPVNRRIVYAASSAGLVRSSDAGDTWAVVVQTSGPTLTSPRRLALSADGATLLAATSGGILRSTDEGAAWTVSVATNPAGDVAFFPGSTTRALATTSGGGFLNPARVFLSTDAGLTWTQTFDRGNLSNDSTAAARIGMSAAAPLTAYLTFGVTHHTSAGNSTDGGFVYGSTNGGLTFQQAGGAQTGTLESPIWVDPTNPNLLVMGGNDLYRSTNAGASWTPIGRNPLGVASVGRGFSAIVGDPRYDGTTNRRVYFGSNRGLSRSDDITAPGGAPNGDYPSLNDGLPGANVIAAAGDRGSRTLLAGTREALLRGVPAGGTWSWTAASTTGVEGAGLLAIDPSDPAYLYAVIPPPAEYNIALPRVMQSADAGATWRFLDWRAFGAAGLQETTHGLALDPSAPDRLYVGGTHLLRTDNVKNPFTQPGNYDGPTWQNFYLQSSECRSGTGPIAVAPGDSDVVWVLNRCTGTIYATADASAAAPAWTAVTGLPPGSAVGRITIDPADAHTVYVSMDGIAPANLWRTRDSGATWSAIGGSGADALAGGVLSFAIDPRNSARLFAGTGTGVFSSADAGATWTAEGPIDLPVTALTWVGVDLVAATDGAGLFVAHVTGLVMSLDDPRPAQSLAPAIVVRGWAIDHLTGTGADAVHVYGFPNPGSGAPPVFLGSAPFVDRPDVAAAFGESYRHSGFELTIGSLATGPWMIVAYAHSPVSNAFDISRAVIFTVATPESRPAMAIDDPSSAVGPVGPNFLVRGWALDAGGSTGAGVDAIHVYAAPASGGAWTFLGVPSYGEARWDVAAVYGARFVNSGYRLHVSGLAPGDYTLIVFARSAVSGSWSSHTRGLTVRAPGDPLMTIDTPSNGASVSQPFNLAGWTIDRDAPSGPGVDVVHVWAFPLDGSAARFVGAGPLNFARGDVGAIFGAQFTDSGYNVPVSGLPQGQYQIVVYAHSTVTGTFNQSRVVTVTVQ